MEAPISMPCRFSSSFVASGEGLNCGHFGGGTGSGVVVGGLFDAGRGRWLLLLPREQRRDTEKGSAQDGSRDFQRHRRPDQSRVTSRRYACQAIETTIRMMMSSARPSLGITDD